MNQQDQWLQLVSEIANHSQTKIIEISMNDTLSEEVIEKIEDEYDIILDSSIKSFFRTFNGLRIQWDLDNSKLNQDMRENIFEYDYYTDITGSVGVINIQPLEESIFELDCISPMFDKSKMNEEVEFKNRIWRKQDFIHFLKPFDLFDLPNDEKCMAFFFDPFTREIDVLCLKNYYGDWNNSILTDFNSYLSFLMTTKGLVRARSVVFEQMEGSRMPKHILDKDELQSFIPKLFQISN